MVINTGRIWYAVSVACGVYSGVVITEFNSLRSILVRAGTENSPFFVYYVGISMKVFAVGASRWSYFLASEYGTFYLLFA
jgi:hypothetical protein